MGCCQSNEVHEGKARNQEIESQLRQDKQNMSQQVKMLLLGAGESGKSTILKQMKLIHDGGYTPDERQAFKEIIFSNTVHSMQVILKAMKGRGVWLKNADSWSYAAVILELPSCVTYEELPTEVTTAIRILWKDSNLQSVFEVSREYQLNDSAKYYFDSIDRIGESNYIPTDQDVLRTRIKTTGITETTFVIGTFTYRMFDVGGQRSERKKWIHCFENVTSIIFMVALSEYDQVLIEDETVNRMDEGLTLFNSICNSKWFIKTSIILFLNKIDIFREKLLKHPLKEKFPDYDGPNQFEPASDYILNQFVHLNQSKTKQLYTHFTCATDTQQIKFVMSAINDIIMKNNLRTVGLL
ncbi:G protein alpha subunit [Phycomyces blakesleeanus]|uniref:G protein alpha subunit n=2 Tax=Phycomyces blakesleeanus TaxID=4837 RepID=A0A162N3I3_PHYB8|nr:G protein alpha subunit [Phycomyces blakesleeanus NRRL 1555(-)]OAD68158.1 G protein alpha subunit [Phycomyces blakesleeanus NRRL 1555(-)]|eukprot:XP_018286198.1 G protein alpha subunit [Phycomyces blakesleeanus NRRL 1555(-)]